MGLVRVSRVPETVPHRSLSWLLPRIAGLRPGSNRWHRSLYFVSSLLILLGSLLIPSGSGPRSEPSTLLLSTQRPVAVKALYAMTPLGADRLRNAGAVEKAVGFLLSLQPDGSYILTSPGVDDVVHMDVAHAAIALAKVGRLAEAEAAMNWLLALMTTPGSADQYGEAEFDGQTVRIDYAGSWYDHYHTSGEPKREMTRGRGEGVGMALIAIYAIYREDPSYLQATSGGASVLDRVALAVRYLTSPSMQHPDGRFNHRPDYRVSFGEEAARMSLGLKLAATMLRESGDELTARLADAGGDRGLSTLHSGEGLNYGMAFDYFAMGIWGLATPNEAREELRRLDEAGMVTSDGVRNWDWQVLNADNWQDRLYFWIASQTIGPSQTFDWAIASIAAGRVADALEVERRWLRLQRDDGSFAGCYALGLRLGIGPPNSYAAARFILLERMLNDALAPGAPRAIITSPSAGTGNPGERHAG